jgi:hypothetical protein
MNKITLLLLLFTSNLNAQWSELGGTDSLNANDQIKSICSDPNGNIYATGWFTKPGDSKYVAKFNGSIWAELAGQNTFNPSYSINSLCSDNIGNIYAAGSFRNSIGYGYVAHFNGSFWSEFEGGNAFTSLKANDDIESICSDKSGRIYAAGWFTKSNGKYYVASGAINGGWFAFGGLNGLNANSFILSMCSDLDSRNYPGTGRTYAAGKFTNIIGKRYVAATREIGPDSYTWEELGGTNSLNANGDILSLCVDKFGNLYAAGKFTNSSGKYYIAKFNGTSWSELGGANSLNANDEIISICSDDAGNIYAAGKFTNSSVKNYIAKFNGTSWSELGGANSLNANGNILSLCVDKFGSLYAAGKFTNSSGKYYVAKFTNSPSIISFTPASAAKGATISINGNYLNGATAVRFGGNNAQSFNVVSTNQITAVVGTGATGNVTVVTPNGTATLTGFTFLNTPTISSITPTIGAQGSTVIINGNNLGGATAVRFGGNNAQSFNVVSTNQITAIVGTGATGDVTVVTPGGTATLAGFIYRTNTGINNSLIERVLSIYPSPAKNIINVDIGNHYKVAEYSIKIINSLGQQVFENKIDQQRFVIEVTNWGGAGVYITLLYDKKGNIVDQRKFFLQ